MEQSIVHVGTSRDRYVPVRLADLIEKIEADGHTFGGVAGRVGEVADAVATVVDQETRGLRDELDHKYAAFNPDRDTYIDGGIVDDRAEANVDALLDRLAYLLDKANYEAIRAVDIAEVLEAASTHGLKVRIRADRVQTLEVYVRGRGRVRRLVRSWRAPVWGKWRTLAVYRRLVVVTRLKGDACVGLRLFRDIPEADLEALLPHAEVQMSWLDRLKVLGGSAGALGGLASVGWRVLLGGAVALTQIVWIVLLSALGFSTRAFFGYRRTKSQRVSQRTQSLLDQQIAANAAVLLKLTHRAGEEEIKEAVLGYAMASTLDAVGAEALGAATAGWLKKWFNAEVHFDASDALESLGRFGLLSGGRVVPVDEALARLAAHRRYRVTRGYHGG